MTNNWLFLLAVADGTGVPWEDTALQELGLVTGWGLEHGGELPSPATGVWRSLKIWFGQNTKLKAE